MVTENNLAVKGIVLEIVFSEEIKSIIIFLVVLVLW